MTKNELIEFLKSKGYVDFKDETIGSTHQLETCHRLIQPTKGKKFYATIRTYSDSEIYIRIYDEENYIISDFKVSDTRVIEGELYSIHKVVL